MKMIIALDKICLIGIVSVSVFVGYKIGRVAEKMDNELKNIHIGN